MTRWGDKLLNENDTEKMELRKTAVWLWVNVHKAPQGSTHAGQPTHTYLGMVVNTLGALLINSSPITTLVTNQRAFFKADFPLLLLMYNYTKEVSAKI